MAKASWKKRIPQTAAFGIPVDVIAAVFFLISRYRNVTLPALVI